MEFLVHIDTFEYTDKNTYLLQSPFSHEALQKTSKLFILHERNEHTNKYLPVHGTKLAVVADK